MSRKPTLTEIFAPAGLITEPLVITKRSGVESYLQLRISRNTLIAIAFSLLLHALVLFFVVPTLLKPPAETTVTQSFDVSLGLPTPENDQPSTPATAPVEPKPKSAKPPKQTTQNKPTIEPATITPPPIALPSSPLPPTTKAESMPVPPVQKNTLDNLKPPPPLVQPDNAPITDMESYKRAQQAKRLAAQGYSQRDINEMMEQSKPPLSEDAKRDAIIQNNLNTSDGGLIAILSRSRYQATIGFRLWKLGFNTNRILNYTVNVTRESDLKMAIVRKIIEVLRQEAPDTFPYESYALKRTVTLSAKPEDNAELESFLFQDLFGPRGIYPE